MQKDKKERIQIKHQNKTKKFRWGEHIMPGELARCFLTSFDIRDKNLKGLLDSHGKLHTIESLVEKPRSLKHEPYMLILEDLNRNYSTSSHEKDAGSGGDSGVENTIVEYGGYNSNYYHHQHHHRRSPIRSSLIQIIDFEEFKQSVLAHGKNLAVVLFVKSKQEFELELEAFEETLTQFFESNENCYYFVTKTGELPLDSSFEDLQTPVVALFQGSKIVFIGDGEAKYDLLKSALTRMRHPTQKAEKSNTLGRKALQKRGSSLQASGYKLLNYLLSESIITEKEYYFIKCLVLEGKREVLEIVEDYQNSGRLQAVSSSVNDLLVKAGLRARPYSGERPQSPDSGISGSGQPYREMSQFNGKEVSRRMSARSKDISIKQEKFIHIVAELEDAEYLTEQTAGIIKSLILEENYDVYKTLQDYINNQYDKRILANKLTVVAGTLNTEMERPMSPMPRRDELIRIVNTIVRQRIRDESSIKFLNELIMRGDEMVYSAFDVFESDRDQNDLIDTLERILSNSMQRRGRSMNKTAALRSVSMPKMLNKASTENNLRNLIQMQYSSGSKMQRSMSPATGFSYFLEASSHKKEKVANQSMNIAAFDNQPKSEEKEPQLKSEEKAPQKTEEIPAEKPLDEQELAQLRATRQRRKRSEVLRDSFQDIIKSLKRHKLVKEFEFEEYGMLFHLAETKQDLIIEIISDNQTDDNQLDACIPPLRAFAKKSWDQFLKSNFFEYEIEKINTAKTKPDSPVHMALQCFKYDRNVSDLLAALKDAIRELESPLKKVPDSAVSIDSKQSIRKRRPEIKVEITHRSGGSPIIIQTDEKPKTSPENQKANSLTLDQIDSVEKEKPKDDGSLFKMNRIEGSLPAEEKGTTTPEQVITEKAAAEEHSPGELKAGESKKKTEERILEQEKKAAEDEKNKAAEHKTTENDKEKQLQNHQTPGKKYQDILPAAEADPFKSSFKLKLHGGADEDVTGTPTEQSQQANAEEGARYSVLIPPKSDLKPHAREVLDHFHDVMGQKRFQRQSFDQMILEATYLTETQKSKLEFLMDQNYRDLYEIVFEYQKNGHTPSVEKQIREMADIDPNSVSIVSSPTQKRRLATFETFEMILQKLKDEKLISEKMFNTFIYLFLEEEVSVLACFEVFLYNGDQTEFIDTLFLIEKVHFFRNQMNQMEILNEFNDIVQDQLKIIYSLRKYLPLQTRIILEKIITIGSTTVADLYKEFRKGNLTKTNFIHKLIEYAESKEAIINQYERGVLENKISGEKDVTTKRKEFFQNFQNSRLVAGLPRLDYVYQMIDDGNRIISSVFEVWEYTRDTQDFIENMTLFHKIKQRKTIIEEIIGKQAELGLTEIDIEKMKTIMTQPKNIIETAYQVYLKTQDDEDYWHTIKLIAENFAKEE